MGGFHIVEDRPTPKAVYNWRIYMMAAVTACGAITFGYDAAFLGTTIARKSFLDHFGISQMSAAGQKATKSNLTSVYLGAAFFGALFAWPIMETTGRRLTLQVAAVIFNVGAILMIATTSSLGMMYAGRVITGLAVGALTACIPTFISEISPPAIRGVCTGLFEVAYQIGGLVGFWINYGVSAHIDPNSVKSFRIPMAIQLIPGGLLAIGAIVIKESPAFLLRKGKDEKALKILTWLRMLPEDHHYIQEEVGLIRLRINEELELAGGESGVLGYLKGAFRELKVKHIRHRVIVTFWMFLFQNFSGAVCINYYSPTIFSSIGISDVNLYTGVYGIVKATGAIVFFLFIVDRAGRRVPWLISAFVCSLCLLYIGVYEAVGKPNGKNVSESTKQGGTAAVVIIMLYSLFWSFGGNGLPWIVSSEIFPIRLRSITGAFSAMSQWLASYASTEAFPYMVASMKWGTFIFFSAICLATFTFTFFWIPDTKGIPIECMEPLFSGPTRHMQFRQKKVFPPNGIPPYPEGMVVGKKETAEAEGEEEKARDNERVELV